MRPDGFNDAIIGYEHNSGNWVYDKEKMISIAVNEMSMSHEDAIEHLEYNVWGAYIGDKTPIYVQLASGDEIDDLIEMCE
tara:strand:+ start:1051 stop:1290 length:240 start_codon:yes stop_codon:yes gene_type:complete